MHWMLLIIQYLFSLTGLKWWRLVIYLSGKFSITVAYSSVYIYVSEVFPTNVRQSLLAICSSTGRIGSTLAPLTPLLVFFVTYLNLSVSKVPSRWIVWIGFFYCASVRRLVKHLYLLSLSWSSIQKQIALCVSYFFNFSFISHINEFIIFGELVDFFQYWFVLMFFFYGIGR